MAIPALARDFKEFLKSLNSNDFEYLLIGTARNVKTPAPASNKIIP
jgi:hypothetical protein